MYKVKRIAQAVQLWKDVFFWLKSGVTISKKINNLIGIIMDESQLPFPMIPVNSGPFVHADRFEEAVMAKSEFTPDDWKKFTHNVDGELTDDVESIITRDVNLLPLNVWKWSRGSRRVFHLTEDIQMFLEATSLGDTLWEDIIFPFDNFFVSLDTPIKGKGCEYDGILVCVYDTMEIQRLNGVSIEEELAPEEINSIAKTMLDITLFPKELGNFRLMNDSLRRNIQKGIQKNQVAQLHWLFEKSVKRGFDRPFLGRLMLFPDAYDQTPISTSIDDLCKNERMQIMIGEYGNNPVQETFTVPSNEAALKLVLNLCLYLECTESGEESMLVNSKPESQSQSLDERMISKSCDFYNVLLDYRILTDEEKSLLKSDPAFRKAYREMGFHWRRAHKRFAPGMKNVPGAKKTVSVKACRIRADKEPVQGLAAGARHVLSR